MACRWHSSNLSRLTLMPDLGILPRTEVAQILLPANIMVIQRRADRRREHQAVITPQRPSSQPFLRLADPQLTQRQSPPRLRGLRVTPGAIGASHEHGDLVVVEPDLGDRPPLPV